MASSEIMGGLIGGILKDSPLAGLGISPQFKDKDIIVEMTQDQLRNLLLEKADQRARDAVTIELHEGKLVVKIRLW